MARPRVLGDTCTLCGASSTYARNLCQHCYIVAWRSIKSGHTTWEELIKRGVDAVRVNTDRKRLLQALLVEPPKEYTGFDGSQLDMSSVKETP